MRATFGRWTTESVTAGERNCRGRQDWRLTVRGSVVQQLRSSAVTLFDVCVGLDLDEHLAVDEGADLDHRCRGADIAEDFAVRAADGFPITSDIDDVDTRPNDLIESGTSARERATDVRESLASLSRGVTDAEELSVGIRGGRTGDVYPLTDTYGA